jgi:hypothetical protein
MDTLKAEQLGSRKWRVLAIPFGGPFAGGRDLDGEYFSPRTDIKAHWFRERPVIFHHGQHSAVKDEEFGVEEMDSQPSKDGWWGTMFFDREMQRSSQYWDQVNRLLAAGKMYGSSGAIAHLVLKAKDGEILRWPHAEQTLTTTPANFYSRITASKALAGFDNAGIALDEAMKAAIADLDAIADDLRPDLTDGGEPTGDLTAGGDAAAMARLAAALDSLERLIRR